MATTRRKSIGPTQREAEEIGGRLKLTRLALGLSPSELCRLTGIKPNTYSNWEGATSRPGLGEAKVLRRTLGYTLDWIYEGDRSGLPMKLVSAIASYEQEHGEEPGTAGTH